MKVAYKSIYPNKNGVERVVDAEVELPTNTNLYTLDYLAIGGQNKVTRCLAIELAIPPGGRIEIGSC